MTLLTVGMELEVETLRRINLPQNLGAMFRTTHDASTEASAPTRDGLHISYGTRGSVETFGFEMVSRILEETDRDLIRHLLMYIKTAGEPRHSKRGSLHVHIGTGYNLKMLKNVTKLWLFSEKFWYHLGGMGYKYRGHINESIYCRPLRASQAAPYGDRWVRSIDVDGCLSAKTSTEFWNKYGIPMEYREKYHPSRYQGLNIYSLLLHNTLEFRVFNKCLKADWVLAVIDLCRAFTAVCINPANDFSNLEENDLFSGSDTMEIWQSLNRILRGSGIDFDPAVITEIINATPEPDIPNPDVKTHLRRFEGMNVMRDHPRVSNPDDSGFLDIHDERSGTYNLFEECD